MPRAGSYCGRPTGLENAQIVSMPINETISTRNCGFAPPFLVNDARPARQLSLGDLRGKFVLLHFWSTLDDNCLQELVRLKALRDRFGKDDRLAMIGFCLATNHPARRRARGSATAWPRPSAGIDRRDPTALTPPP